jgi:predicted RNA binding protein YcfA (HicA-like mRNA interferase family)
MTGRELVKLMKRNGWVLDHINGSHHIMKKNSEIEVIPVHNTDLKPGLLNAVLKRTGLK